MRDARFVAEHRGGPLKRQQHNALLEWASKCVKHVLDKIGENSNPSFIKILDVGEAWKNGNASVGDARNAAFAAIAIAKALEDPVKIAAARAVGHVVAVAHMADHALRAADYALKALSKDERVLERQWQNEQLPVSIKSLVLATRK
ncbi:hypothetical protein SAMN04487996_103371 [Dyadobacter soli]|uniref:Imm-5-like domain-containing protein n=1 Tax=Dyadobacter soli TaxID=659014 RepID=A0A1G7AAY5_9BACT|nr:hypothetical protein [Dyadobacter soli]SDE11036.1 hypothetical protein SAMN04487996_103371 [Dyadobacter soli]